MAKTITYQNKLFDFYFKIKKSNFIQNLNKFIYSIWSFVFISFLTLSAYIFSLEIYFYLFIALYVIYICLFCDDLLPIVCLFIFCYISPSRKNNPGLSTNSVFYNYSGTIVTIIAVVCTISILSRIILDKNMGLKKLFTQKKYLLSGMIILGIAYLISGIGSKNYSEYFLNNLLFAFLQFLSIFLIYFIFSTSINWKNLPKYYFPYMCIFIGIVASLEIVYIYLTNDVILDGMINRSILFTGWGTYNNVGAMIAITIPFAFYLACKKKHNYIYIVLATILLLGTIISCSRGSILGAIVIYIISFIISIFKAENKKIFWISSGILIIVASIIGLIFFDEVSKLFSKVPKIVESTGGDVKVNDSSRFYIYEKGFKAFLKYPIFGQTFYPTNFVPYDFSTIDSFSLLFPPRWHNTIIQLLSSCGTVGILAYGFHRFQTIKLIIKKPSLEKTFIGLSILTLLAMSLLDCHIFNIGPTMFYSISLMFAEFSNQKEKNISFEDLIIQNL